MTKLEVELVTTPLMVGLEMMPFMVAMATTKSKVAWVMMLLP